MVFNDGTDGCLIEGKQFFVAVAIDLQVDEPLRIHMGCSKTKIGGFPPKSSILTGFSIINHPFWGTPIFGNTHISYRKPGFSLYSYIPG